MKLTSFRVTNFRSVNDSGEIDVSRIAALVGRNESGKTNLLLALESMNPAEGRADLSETKDFPRHRPLTEFNANLPVVTTRWVLTDAEREELSEIFPRSENVESVRVRRHYHSTLSVELEGLAPLAVRRAAMTAAHAKFVKSLSGILDAVEGEKPDALRKASESLKSWVTSEGEPAKWATGTKKSIKALSAALEDAELTLKDDAMAGLKAIEEHASEIEADGASKKAAHEWVVAKIPTFMYLSEYPEIEGHQNIGEYLARKEKGKTNDEDHYFEKLMKVAGLDAKQLHSLLADDHEKRQQLANRAGAVVTAAIRRLWRDRKLKVRFNPDAEHFDILVIDPESTYDVEVNLDERSRGFQWFFSFFVTFAADTKEGPAENAIILLDEPGLYLHALAQRDLLDLFKNDFQNQIIFTTHSPFMVPVENLDTVRTVNIDAEGGTLVSNSPTGDRKTLFPLKAALGYELVQSLEIGPASMILEGVTDYWIISSISEKLRDEGRPSLPTQLSLNPAGGAQRVTYMVSFLSSEGIRVLVLLDDEKLARATRDDLTRSKLIRDDYVVLVSAGLDPAPQSADIEDLIEPAVYDSLVRESYAEELKGKSLTPNLHVPRIVKRYEEAFAAVGLEFNKTRPARRLLRRMATEPDNVLTPKTRENFDRLFAIVRARFEKLSKADWKPFQ